MCRAAPASGPTLPTRFPAVGVMPARGPAANRRVHGQYGEEMAARARTIAIVLSACITAVAGFVTAICFFQPWRSCPYEDTSAGCAMLPGDAAVMAVSMLSTLVGLVLLGIALMLRPR